MIEAIDLSKRYPNGHLALDVLNLRVGAGEIYCLLGAKGAGKTTAVNLFLGFTAPTAGKARIGGLDVTEEPLRTKERIAYLADTTAFYHRLTALQNLDFFARLGGRRHPTRHECEMALREVGLPESAFGQRVSQFGPGGLRKLGIAAALLKGARPWRCGCPGARPGGRGSSPFRAAPWPRSPRPPGSGGTGRSAAARRPRRPRPAPGRAGRRASGCPPRTGSSPGRPCFRAPA